MFGQTIRLKLEDGCGPRTTFEAQRHSWKGRAPGTEKPCYDAARFRGCSECGSISSGFHPSFAEQSSQPLQWERRHAARSQFQSFPHRWHWCVVMTVSSAFRIILILSSPLIPSAKPAFCRARDRGHSVVSSIQSQAILSFFKNSLSCFVSPIPLPVFGSGQSRRWPSSVRK